MMLAIASIPDIAGIISRKYPLSTCGSCRVLLFVP
jgi:hypothetical protein